MKRRDAWELIVTFFLAAGIVSAAFFLAGIMPGGAFRAMDTDSYDQMTSMQMMLARRIREGGPLFYSMDTSLGQNTALLYAFCAYSPTTLLFLLIPDAYAAMIAGMILRLALAALCFHLFLRFGLGWERRENILFALCYGLCGFSAEYLLSVNLLDGLYLLPLVMWALFYAVRTKRVAALVPAYAAAFMIQFYSGYLIGLFSAASLLAILFLRDGSGFLRKNIRFLLRWLYAVVCAVLISMVFLAPAIAFFLSGTGISSVALHERIPFWDLLYAFLFGRALSIETEVPFLYAGIPMLLLVPLYFANKEIPKRERLLCAAAALSLPLSLYVDPLYSLLHAFNRPDGFTVRYAFLYVFFFLLLAARALYKGAGESATKGRTVLYFGIQLALYELVIVMHGFLSGSEGRKDFVFALAGSAVFYLCWMIVLLCKAKSGDFFRAAAFVLVISELGAQFLINSREQGLVDAKQALVWEEESRELLSQTQQYGNGDGLLYRAFPGNTPVMNHSALYGYRGIGQFASSNYSALQSLLVRLGDEVSSMRYTQAGATDASDMLFGIRIRMRMSGKGEEAGTAGEAPVLYERALPLGYMVSPSVLEMEEFDGNPFENQNRLLSALCGERIRAYVPAEAFAYETDNADLRETDAGYEIRTLSAENYGDVLFGIPREAYEHAYMYLQLSAYTGETKEKLPDPDMAMNTALFSPADRKGSGARYGIAAENAILEMTADGNAFVARLADFDGPDKCFRYADQYFCYQDEEALDRAYAHLSRSPFRAESARNGHFTGKVTSTAEQPLLLFTIPYDKGWSVTVDGQAQPLYPVVKNSFCAVVLTPGEHALELRFTASGEAEGRLLALGGLILFLLLILSENHKMMHERRKIEHQ
ncbi:MAG: YfhO family protein [Lachnospiraceae bacterium]|nr:YfhO family protein [Lachnospiraceae bacterium]